MPDSNELNVIIGFALLGFALTFMSVLLETRRFAFAFSVAGFTPATLMGAYLLIASGDNHKAEVAANTYIITSKEASDAPLSRVRHYAVGVMSEADSLNLEARSEFKAFMFGHYPQTQATAQQAIQTKASTNQYVSYAETLMLRSWLHSCFGEADFLDFPYPLTNADVRTIIRTHQEQIKGPDHDPCLTENPA